MVKPNPIIESAVRIQAMRVLSAAITDRSTARSVRSSARIVPRSFVAVSTSMKIPSDRFFDRYLRNLRTSSNARHYSTKNQVGQNGEKERDNDRFSRINKVQFDNLI